MVEVAQAASVRSHYDLVVIGSGPAGEKAAALAAYHGKQVAVIEASGPPGGTMVGGVVASKTMREAALYLTSFRARHVYGVGVDVAPDVAMKGARDRADHVEWLLSQSVLHNLERHGIDYVVGTAALAGPGTVQVTTSTGETSLLEADVVLLATGSRPFRPPEVPFDHRDVYDADDALGIEHPVRSVVVIGGGAVACEYASIFAALGSDVTIVESGPALLPYMDEQISSLLAGVFTDMGVRVLLQSGRAEIADDGDGLVVRLADGSALYPAKVVVAAGRTGNTQGLGLETVGVATDGRGYVVVDADFQTTVPGIYAAGDVTGPPALASVAMEQARVAACRAFGIATRDAVDAVTPYGVYSMPEVAMVGLTEQAARAAGIDVAVGCARLSRNARNAIRGDRHGLVKLVFRRDDHQLLGAHVLGENATELIHLPQAVLHFGGSIDYFVATTFNTPTETEAFKYAAYDGLSRVENRATLTAHA